MAKNNQKNKARKNNEDEMQVDQHESTPATPVKLNKGSVEVEVIDSIYFRNFRNKSDIHKIIVV